MWVKFYRNNLPLFGDHTTNRIERQFWSFKESLRDTFSKAPKTSEAIIHLLKFINDRLQERNIVHNSKRLVIFDTDKKMYDLNKDASKVLNERRENFSMDIDGVTEVFKNNDSKLYTCTEVSCICIFHKENLVPCPHILFTREQNGSPTFDADTFDRRYRRGMDDDEEMVEEVAASGSQEQENIPVDFINKNVSSHVEGFSLTDKEMYNIIRPTINSIASLVCCHTKNTFFQYNMSKS